MIPRIPAASFSLDERPDLAALVAKAREAFGEDAHYVEHIARAGAAILAKRDELPDRERVY